MKARNLIKLLVFVGLLWSCEAKDQKNEYTLPTAWKLDVASGDSVLLPLDDDFNRLVSKYLNQIKDNQDVSFLYNVQFDTVYKWNNAEWVQNRSVRGVVMSKVNNKALLEQVLEDSTFISIWEKAKLDLPDIRTNVEMIEDRLIELKE